MIINLQKKINSWVESGVLSEEQAQKIIDHEAKQLTRPWVLYGIAAIGVTTMVTGVVSIIAANWEMMTEGVKLIAYFLVQLGLGALVLKLDSKEKSVWREMALFAFAMFFFAGIGLVAQIFNLHSSTWRGLLFWLVLTFPVVLQARSALLNHIWVLIAFGTSWAWVDGSYFYGYENKKDAAALQAAIVASVPFVLASLGFLLNRLNPSNWSKFQEVTTFWGIGSVVVCGSIISNGVWVGSRYHEHEMVKYLAIPWVFLLLTCASSMWRPIVTDAHKKSTAVLLFVIGLFVSIPLVFDIDLSRGTSDVIGAITFLIIWALAASSAALANYKKLFDLASLVIAIRFIVIYFEVFGSLTTTGFGLIFSGGVILAVAYYWYKYRKKVEALIQESA